jgi:L-alanine-DL-glutamate epimerase-like enolase superfamily enzyme
MRLGKSRCDVNTNMKISTVSAEAVRIPVSEPTRMSTRLLSQRDYLIVTVEADGSTETGVGYVYAGTSGGSLLKGATSALLAPILVGQNSSAILDLWERMYQETLLVGRRGLLLRAMSAVDIALWDLAAKRAGLPLTVLLGGSVRSVPAYASGGYYRPEAGPWDKAVTEEIRQNRSLGFRDHKIKVGGLSIKEDAARVKAAVEAIGPDGRLALDANNAYRSVSEAMLAIRAFEKAAGDLGLWWIEEPLSPDDIEGHSQIARMVETPIATGELLQTRWEFRQLIESQGADIIQPDAGVLGGISEWMRVVRLAETFAVPVAPHWHANLHAHLVAASQSCLAVEHFLLEKDIYNFERLVTPSSRLKYQNGLVEVPNRPGIGIELDQERLKDYRIADQE